MKISDTIIGSFIIGVLIGGSILISQGGNEKRHAKFKMMKQPHMNIKHKETKLNDEEKSGMEFIIQSDGKRSSSEDISNTVEQAINKALESFPEDVDIQIKIKTKKD